jgi:hypothetical protein
VASDYTLATGSASVAATITAKPLTVAANNQSKTYGNTITFTGSEFTTAGLNNSETVGSAVLTSAGAVNTAQVTGSPYAIVASTATGGTFTPSDYTITYASGNLTVNPAALAIQANDASRPQGAANPPFTATYTGFKLGETPAVLAGTLAFSTPATIASLPGIYTISPLGQTSSNYSISYINGVLTVGSPLQSVIVFNVQSGDQLALLQQIGLLSFIKALPDCVGKLDLAAGDALSTVALTTSRRCGSNALVDFTQENRM